MRSVDIDEPTGATAPGALHQHSRRIALSVVLGQIAVGICLAVALTAGWGWRFGYSALAGAVIGIVPTYYLAVRMFKRPAHASADKALRNIYLGEGIKVVFTVALFVLAMMLLDVELPALAGGYIATVAANWIAIYRADLRESPGPRA